MEKKYLTDELNESISFMPRGSLWVPLNELMGNEH